MTSLGDISESGAPDGAGDATVLWAPARAMVEAGAAANALGFWDDGCRLWRALFRQGAVGEIAAQGCAEAALHAGRFGLADHALAHCGQSSERLAAATENSRDARAKQMATDFVSAQRRDNNSINQLLDARSFDRILAYVTPDAADPEAISIVVRALFGLGRYDGIVALTDCNPAGVDENLVAAARDRMAKRRDDAGGAAEAWLAEHRHLSGW